MRRQFIHWYTNSGSVVVTHIRAYVHVVVSWFEEACLYQNIYSIGPCVHVYNPVYMYMYMHKIVQDYNLCKFYNNPSKCFLAYVYMYVWTCRGIGDGFYSSAFQSQLEGNALYKASMPARKYSIKHVFTCGNWVPHKEPCTYGTVM